MGRLMHRHYKVVVLFCLISILFYSAVIISGYTFGHIKLKVISTYTVSSKWDATQHAQGAETDGVNIWFSSGMNLAKFTVIDFDYPDAINEYLMYDGELSNEANGICLKDNYIYVSNGNYVPPYINWVKWYDKNTLEFIGYKRLQNGGILQEAIVYYDNYWWSISFGSNEITQYDGAFNYLRVYKLPSMNPNVISNVGGIDWDNGQLWLDHYNTMYIFNFDGKKFTLDSRIEIPSEVKYPQGFGISPDHKYLYMADFYNTPDVEVLHKIEIIR